MALLLDLLVSGQTRLNDDTYAKNIYADKFIRTGSSDLYVLLGGGGHKLLSDFSMAHEHPYLPLAGGTVTGDIGTKSFYSGTDGLGLYIEGKSNLGLRIQYNKSTTGSDYDQLLLKNGVLKFNSKEVIHSGNIGSYAAGSLTTTSKSIWGQTYWNSNGVPIDISISQVAKMPYVLFKNYDNDGAAGYVGRGASNRNDIQIEAYSGNKLELGANNSIGMTFTTSNNVGIGTSSPNAKLHVTGTIAIINDIVDSTYDALGYFRHYSNNDWGLIVDKSQSYTYGLKVQASGQYAFWVGNGNSRFVGAAKFGQDASPSYTVDINGDFRSTSTVNAESYLNYGNTLYKRDYRFIHDPVCFIKQGDSTGTICIVLPVVGTSSSCEYDMPIFKITIYEYSSQGASEITIGGHNWYKPWYNCTYYVTGNYNKGVRLANRSSDNRYCILLGTTSTTWSYVAVYLTEVLTQYSTGWLSKWRTDYSISQITNESGYTITTPGFSYGNYAAAKHEHTYILDSGNSSHITFKYSSGGFSSNPSYLGAWNGYELTYVSPSVLNVNYASSSNYANSAGSAGSAGKLTSLGNYVYSNLSTDIPTNAVSYKIITSGGTDLGDSQYNVLHIPWSSGDWGTYLLFGANNGRFGVKYKHSGAVREVLDSGNYTNYAARSSHSHSEYVLKTGDTMSGALYFSQNKGGHISADSAGLYMQCGSYWIRVNYNGSPDFTGQTMWHSGNDGSGSGLDADTLDSFHANRFTFVYNSANYNDNYSLTVNQMAADGNSNSHVGMIYAGTDNPVSSSGNWVHVWSQTWSRGTISSWCSQIALGVQQGTGMWYRTTSGALAGRGWNRVLDSANYTSYVNNYYWANVKISTTPNTSTSPTFDIPISRYSRFTNGSEIIGYVGRGSSNNNLYFENYKNANIVIYTNNNSSNCICLTGEGKVGIGITDPSQKLTVNGNIAFTSNGIIGASYGTSDTTMYNNITINAGTGGIQYNSGSWTSGDHVAHNFLTGSSNSSKLVIMNNSGNVGIGTTSPSERLSVNGWVGTLGNTGWYSISHGGGIYMEDSTWVRVYNNKKFYVDNSEYNAIHSAGGVYVAGMIHSYGNYLKSTCNDAYVQIGPQNSSHAHYVTSASVSHWFNKTVQVDGNIEPYGNNEHSAGSTSYRFSNVYSYSGNFAGPITSHNYHQVYNSGSYTNAAGNVTGAIVIQLPITSSQYDMINVEIAVYEYNSQAASKIIVGGHPWQGKWYNYSCSVIGGYTRGVRLGIYGGKWCIILGTSSTVWSYPGVFVTHIGTVYDSYSSAYTSQCTLSLVTSESGFSSLFTPTNVVKATHALDAGNNTPITFHYSTGGFSSNPSWVAAWNGYDLTYVSPSVLNVNYASSATYLYASDSPYRYGDSNPYYMKMRYNVNGDSRWYLSVYPETPKTVAVDYSYKSGNADKLNGYSYNGLPYLPISGGTCTGNIYAPAFYESSDERLKDFYNTIDVDLDKLSSLPKKFFKWKSNPNGEFEIGTSAQELQKIYPQLVNTDDKGYLTVAYDKLSIVALRAIDKLYEMNKNLERRIQILESKH